LKGVSWSSTYISIVVDPIASGKVIEINLKRIIHWLYLVSENPQIPCERTKFIKCKLAMKKGVIVVNQKKNDINIIHFWTSAFIGDWIHYQSMVNWTSTFICETATQWSKWP
jgi:hypothetical protein